MDQTRPFTNLYSAPTGSGPLSFRLFPAAGCSRLPRAAWFTAVLRALAALLLPASPTYGGGYGASAHRVLHGLRPAGCAPVLPPNAVYTFCVNYPVLLVHLFQDVTPASLTSHPRVKSTSSPSGKYVIPEWKVRHPRPRSGIQL